MCVCFHTGSGSGIGAETLRKVGSGSEKSDPDPKKSIPDPQHCMELIKVPPEWYFICRFTRHKTFLNKWNK